MSQLNIPLADSGGINCDTFRYEVVLSYAFTQKKDQLGCILDISALKIYIILKN